MKKLVLTITLITFVLLLISFANQYFTIQRREASIFDGECTAPCWRNITPGKTTTQDAYDLISGFSDIEIEDIYKGDHYNFFDSYYDIILSSGVRVWIGTVDDKVIIINLSDHDNKGISTFGRCVSEFGSPEFATQSVSGYIFFTALSPQKGVAYGFDTFNPFITKKFFSQGSKITLITYFDTNYYEALLERGELFPSNYKYDKNDLRPWVGYGNIFELYPYQPASP